MISFDLTHTRFQLRAAAVIEHHGSVLLHGAIQDQFWSLPGGRVEVGEYASATVVRELKEELGESVECGQLLCVAENFFEYSGKRHHEIGLYFLVHLAPESQLLTRGESFLGSEPDVGLEFAWFRKSGLRHLDVRPEFLRRSLSKSPFTFEHVIQQD